MRKVLPKLRKESSDWEGFSFPQSNHRPEVFGPRGEACFWGMERADSPIKVKGIRAFEMIP